LEWGTRRVMPVRSLCDRILLFFLITAILAGLMSACGKKGPPFLPEKGHEARARNLTGKWLNGQIKLEGTVDGTDQDAVISGCMIDQAWYPEDAPLCEGCPVKMTALEDAFDVQISGSRFTCLIPVSENRGIWFFQVRLIDGGGAVGPASERIMVRQ